jgi:transposase
MSKLETSTIKLHPEYVAVVNELAIKDLRIAEKDTEIAELKRDLEIFKKHIFGAKSEKLKKEVTFNAQGSLFAPRDIPETVKEDDEVVIPAHKRRKRKRYTDKNGNLSHFPAELERKETVLKPEGSKTCESCGKDKKEIYQVVTEKLQVKPAQFYVERFVRPVMGCNCKECAPAKAGSPEELLPKSILGQSFIALSLTQKFAWHLPFYRQSQMLEQVGIEIDSNVLINTALKVASQLSLIVREMAKQITQSKIVHIDETPCTVAIRGENGKKKYNRHSYFWPILADGMVVFEYTGDRKHCNVKNLLGDNFKGVLMSDAYDAYANYAKINPSVILALCWDHARRKFVEIQDSEPLAVDALTRIGEFYKIERDIKTMLASGKLSQQGVSKYRKQHALDKLNRFKDWCQAVRDKPEVLPKSKLLAAVSYVLNHWQGLTEYLENGIIPISNIKVEQQIRNLKLGSNNWLFASSEIGAEAVAVFNSLVCTCKMNKINILDYLSDILGRLTTDPASKLTPLAWGKERIENKLATD